jgi:hypothetical protein
VTYDRSSTEALTAPDMVKSISAKYGRRLVSRPKSTRFYSKRVNAEAGIGIVQGMKLEEQERPEREAGQKKKEADDLEAVRQKNQKTFHP